MDSVEESPARVRSIKVALLKTIWKGMDFSCGLMEEYTKEIGCKAKSRELESISGQMVKFTKVHLKMISALGKVFSTILTAKGSMVAGEMEVSMAKDSTYSPTELFTQSFIQWVKRPEREK